VDLAQAACSPFDFLQHLSARQRQQAIIQRVPDVTWLQMRGISEVLLAGVQRRLNTD
jgi:hypothetical protein